MLLHDRLTWCASLCQHPLLKRSPEAGQLVPRTVHGTLQVLMSVRLTRTDSHALHTKAWAARREDLIFYHKKVNAASQISLILGRGKSTTEIWYLNHRGKDVRHRSNAWRRSLPT